MNPGDRSAEQLFDDLNTKYPGAIMAWVRRELVTDDGYAVQVCYKPAMFYEDSTNGGLRASTPEEGEWYWVAGRALHPGMCRWLRVGEK